ncbi:MAG: polysaccharide pyruvyl transferase family protein [Acidimicrobiia bacterium]
MTTWLFRRTGDWRARQAEAGVAKRTPPAGSAPRVGLFGHIGSGNLGNDASVEVVLTYLQASHTGAVVDAMCKSPDRLRRQYGVEAIPLLWYSRYEEQSSGVPAIVLKVLGKGVDAFRTASWVRRHDVVIVPGTGLLESSLPLRPWHMPYALFLLCTSGRLFGTKIALVSVGATTVNQRATRWLLNSAARLAFYRSYRDVPSWDAMRASGIDPADGRIYPDLVFGLDTPTGEPGDPRTVGVGVMAYHGGNDDRREADRIHARYLGEMKRFIRWLVDGDRRVRLFWGDDADGSTVEEILADVRAHRPDLQPGQVVAERCSSLRELIAKMASVGSVVATRYHNVVCALKLSKPTISIGYGSKHEALMADMGMSEFALSARALHSDELIARFGELERRSPELRRALAERSDTNGALVGEQFSMLSSVLFSEHDPCRGVGMRPPAA